MPIFDAGKINDPYFIAYEYVDGEPLSQVNNGGKAPIRWAAMTVCKLAESLRYAHEQSFIHRDVKPENVLIDRNGEPQLLDFGLAKRLDDNGMRTVGGTVLGTPACMSPEQARVAKSEIPAPRVRKCTGPVPALAPFPPFTSSFDIPCSVFGVFACAENIECRTRNAEVRSGPAY